MRVRTEMPTCRHLILFFFPMCRAIISAKTIYIYILISHKYLAAEVWMRVSLAGTRCTRCTPDSWRRTPKTPSPLPSNPGRALTEAVASRNPPICDSERESVSQDQPRNCARRAYMRKSSPANNDASAPPVPARTLVSLVDVITGPA